MVKKRPGGPAEVAPEGRRGQREEDVVVSRIPHVLPQREGEQPLDPVKQGLRRQGQHHQIQRQRRAPQDDLRPRHVRAGSSSRHGRSLLIVLRRIMTASA